MIVVLAANAVVLTAVLSSGIASQVSPGCAGVASKLRATAPRHDEESTSETVSVMHFLFSSVLQTPSSTIQSARGMQLKRM